MTTEKTDKVQSEAAITKLPTAFLERIERAMVGLSDAKRIEIRREIVTCKTVAEAEDKVRELLGLVRGEHEGGKHHGFK